MKQTNISLDEIQVIVYISSAIEVESIANKQNKKKLCFRKIKLVIMLGHLFSFEGTILNARNWLFY